MLQVRLLVAIAGASLMCCQESAVQEPPVLLATAAFSNRSDDTRLHNLILSCVAYGEPLPQIEWLWRTDNNTAFPLREHSDNFSTATTKIATTLEDYDIVSVVSVLVVCDADLHNLPAIQCSASNGLCEEDSVGYQTVRFTLDSNINIQFIKEVSESCLATDAPPSNQATENTSGGSLDTQTTDTAPRDYNTLIIATSVVVCVTTISVATIIGICVLAAVQCRRKNTTEMIVNDTRADTHPYTNLEYELNSKLSQPSARIAVREKAVTSNQEHTYESIAFNLPAAYSSLQTHWSIELLEESMGETSTRAGVPSVQVHQPETPPMLSPEKTPELPTVLPAVQVHQQKAFSTSCAETRSLAYCNAYNDVTFEHTGSISKANEHV